LIVVDTSVVLAFMNRRDAAHASVRAWMKEVDDLLSTTPLVLAEIDHLVLAAGGAGAARALWDDLDRGAYQVEWWSSALEDTLAVARRYEGMELGLADASLIALAAHVDTTRIATLDERHFRAVRPAPNKHAAFTLLPADAG
jgi:predicted nucleic acid-binding protein